MLELWQKALERKTTDPEGAITAARSLVEAVLRHVLDEYEKQYEKSADLHDLYKAVADVLCLNAEQHEEVLVKKILGGCSSVISGLDELRNRVGDAHGHGRQHYRARARHAELAVNMAGAMCLFIVQTLQLRRSSNESLL